MAEATGAIRFYLNLDGMPDPVTFKEVSGGDIEIEVIDDRSTGKKGELITTKHPGNVKYGNITLRRARTDNTFLADWRQAIVDGKVESNRKNGSISGLNAMSEEIYRLDFTKAWPFKEKIANHDVTKNEIAIEEFELCVETLKRSK
jgi:phage tail-like protein